jgi:hypothetical protein
MKTLPRLVGERSFHKGLASFSLQDRAEKPKAGQGWKLLQDRAEIFPPIAGVADFL